MDTLAEKVFSYVQDSWFHFRRTRGWTTQNKICPPDVWRNNVRYFQTDKIDL